MSAASDSIAASITNAWRAAIEAQDAATAYAEEAITASKGYVIGLTTHSPSRPDKPVVEAPPSVDFGDMFENEYDSTLQILKDLLDDRLSDFLDTYFPDYATKLATISDWIDNQITNGGTGLPADIEAQIWDRNRSREDLNAMRAEEELASVWASRGFPVPTGILAKQSAEVRDENQLKSNDMSRDIAIKQAELEIENIRFAIQQGVALHVGVLRAATDYMNAIIAVAGQANAKASALIAAIQNLYAMTVQYYQAQIAAEELILKYDQIRSDALTSFNDTYVSEFRARMEARVNAAVAAAQSMGQLAAAAISSQNTMATIAHETSASE